MPVMDGLETTRQLRARGGLWQRVPIIALTANAFNEDREKCLAAGMNGYLSKPIHMDALGEVLNEILQPLELENLNRTHR